jgi:hypothetical protein
MKRFVEALVMRRMGAAIAATAVVLAVAAPVAYARLPVVKLEGSASLTRSSAAGGSVGTAVKFHVTTTFSTDTPGAQLFTLRKAVVFFPDHAGTNGRLFPSCSARRISRSGGAVSRCPRGSKIGSGTVTAKALQLGVTANGRVTMFNGPHGKSITFNVQSSTPASIDESFDAPLVQLHGKYGERLTLVDPPSLQEILSGVFVGVQRFDVTVSGAVPVHGVTYTYFRARTCPKWAMHGVFDFEDMTTGQTATTTADAKVRCTARR